MLGRKNRRISIWTGLAILLSALVVGLTLSASGALAGAPVGTQGIPGKQVSVPRITGTGNKIQAAKPARPEVVLYDQYNNATTAATVAQNFEAANDAFDNELADDFVVPAGPAWNVDNVEVDGLYFNGPGPAASVNVTFRANNAGIPGAVVASYPNNAFTDVSGGLGDFSINLVPAASLPAGSYWMVIQVNMDFTPGGEWGWADRSVTSNTAAVWQNPGGGFGTACTTWGPRGASCGIDAVNPDQVFRLNGSAGPTPTPNPNTATPTNTPCVPSGYSITTATATMIPAANLVPLSQGDDQIATVALPFPVSFYGAPFSSINLSTNGNAQFTSVNTAFTNACLPTATMNNLLSPHWDDLHTGTTNAGCSAYTSSCGIFTDTLGTTPNRTFVIEWRAVYFADTANAVNFEVLLHENSNAFEVVYGASAGTGANGVSATSGVQQGTGTAFTQFSCNTAVLTNGLRLNYTFNTGTCLTATPTNTLAPTNTPTITLTRTITSSPTPTNTPACTPEGYTVVTGAATVVPAANRIDGVGCDDCNTTVVLPFALSLYGQTFTTANIGSNGYMSFGTFSNTFYSGCLPNAAFTNTIFPFETDQDTRIAGKGIFTDVVGSVGSRTYYVEWRNCRYNGGTCLANSDSNYELVFNENTPNSFEMRYGTFGSANATVGAIGTQRTSTIYTQIQCNLGAPASSQLILTYTTGTCPSPTPLPTFTPTPIPPTLTPSNTPACPGAWTSQAPATSVLDNAVASQGGNLYSFSGVSLGAIIPNSYKYDPVGNVWSPIAPLPAAREQASAVSDGTFIYILGGADTAGANSATVYRYDPVANTYTTMAPFVTATWAQAAAYVVEGGLGKIYKVAGCGANCGTFLNVVEKYDIATNTWTTIAPYPITVGWLMCTGLNNQVYCAGGINTVSVANAYRYDVGTSSWVAIASMPARRWGSAEANVKTKWMLAGGYVFDGTVDTISNSTVQYDPGTNTWAAKDPMLAARSRMGGDSVGVAMYAVGGRDPVAGGFNGTTDNQRFIDLCQGTATPTFTGTPPTNTPTRTLTNTPIPTATACGSYAIATGTATLVPGVTLVTGSQGDDLVAAVALPFPFSFYGTPFSSANVSTNGNLQFSSTNTAFTNVCLPTATMNNLISPHWDDLRTDATLGNCTLYTGGQCGIFTDLQGSVGTRVFTIEWRAIYFSPTTQRANFEIKLFEADNHIEFVYGLVEQGGSSATIGVQQGTGTLFTQYACNTAGSITANLQVILTPQGCATATPTAIPTSTATPTPAGIINGHLTWQNVLAANRPAVTGTLTLCNAGVPQNYAVSTNTNGDFTIATGLPDGTYNWRLKGGRHLATSGTITFSGGSATMDFGLQRGGDAIQSPASQNNIVNSSDFNALKLVFGQGGTFSSDFDYNGVVNSSDFNILKLNFGQAGAPVNCP